MEEAGFALITLKLDLGLNPADCYVDIFKLGRIVAREDIEVGGFNDLNDILDVLRHRIAQKYVFAGLWA